jgi:hypothetical protein
LEFKPTLMCELLVGLPDVIVTAVEDRPDGPIVVHIEARLEQVWCAGCGSRAGVKERQVVELVDLPCSGRRGWRACEITRQFRSSEQPCEGSELAALVVRRPLRNRYGRGTPSVDSSALSTWRRSVCATKISGVVEQRPRPFTINSERYSSGGAQRQQS